MTPELLRIGESKSPVLVLDGFGDLAETVEIAAAMAPFPASGGNHYPGLRRKFSAADVAADGYVVRMLEAAAPYIGGAFDVDGFDLLEASFSMVTAPPETLADRQRMPHFDSTDPNYIAVLHYLSSTAGTAFFRHRATGVEVVDEGNVECFLKSAIREGAPSAGYVQGSDSRFEQIAAVEGRAGRIVAYRGALLHSGIIPPGSSFSADPRQGRLTANIFVKGH